MNLSVRLRISLVRQLLKIEESRTTLDPNGPDECGVDMPDRFFVRPKSGIEWNNRLTDTSSLEGTSKFIEAAL